MYIYLDTEFSSFNRRDRWDSWREEGIGWGWSRWCCERNVRRQFAHLGLGALPILSTYHYRSLFSFQVYCYWPSLSDDKTKINRIIQQLPSISRLLLGLRNVMSKIVGASIFPSLQYIYNSLQLMHAWNSLQYLDTMSLVTVIRKMPPKFNPSSIGPPATTRGRHCWKGTILWHAESVQNVIHLHKIQHISE